MTEHPDYVVIRRHPDLPEGFYTGDLDGKWFDRRNLPDANALGPFLNSTYCEAVAVPTGRFETREDGAVAEVWEIRP